MSGRHCRPVSRSCYCWRFGTWRTAEIARSVARTIGIPSPLSTAWSLRGWSVAGQKRVLPGVTGDL